MVCVCKIIECSLLCPLLCTIIIHTRLTLFWEKEEIYFFFLFFFGNSTRARVSVKVTGIFHAAAFPTEVSRFEYQSGH